MTRTRRSNLPHITTANPSSNQYTADITLTLKLELQGPDRNKKKQAIEILKDSNTYKNLLHGHEFDTDTLRIFINSNCTSVTLNIKGVKLTFYGNIDRTGVIDELNDNLASGISDGWGENGIVFGEPRWLYSESYSSSSHNRTTITKIQATRVKPYNESYYLDGGAIVLPPEVNPTLEYGIPKGWCERRNVLHGDDSVKFYIGKYFYKHVHLSSSLLHYENSYGIYKNEYGKRSQLPGAKDLIEVNESGWCEVPKKLESNIAKNTEYWYCRPPNDVGYRSYPKDKLPKGISFKLLRKDKHSKKYPRYFLDDKQVYIGQPNLIWWISGVVTKVENMMSKVEVTKEWNVRHDEYYYGDIPPDLTFKKLQKIMKNGIIKYKKEAGLYNEILSRKDLADVLERWFEHDSNTNDYFDYIVDEDEYDTFSRNVIENAFLIQK